MISGQWDLVRVPFPFTERQAAKKRPAVVLSARAFNAASGHTVMAMVTKRDHSAWPDDYDIQEWAKAGLKFPSWIRLKLFTLENSLLIDRIGALQPIDVTGFKASAARVIF